MAITPGALGSVSAHELDASVPPSAMLVATGESVVTEKSGTLVLLRATDSAGGR